MGSLFFGGKFFVKNDLGGGDC